MKGVLQRRLTEDGDCLTACIASILEYDYDEVPDFALKADFEWWQGVQQWLGMRGFQMLRIQLNGNTPWFPMEFSPVCICVGPNKSNRQHATVGFPEAGGLGENLKVVQIWDPAEGNGVESVDDLIFLVPLDPKKQITITRQIFYNDAEAKHIDNANGTAPDAPRETGSN